MWIVMLTSSCWRLDLFLLLSHLSRLFLFDVQQDLVNSCKRQGKKLEDWFVGILTVHLIDIVHQMHRCQIIHADFKPDNILVTQLWVAPYCCCSICDRCFQFYFMQLYFILYYCLQWSCLHCFDAVGWAAGRASGRVVLKHMKKIFFIILTVWTPSLVPFMLENWQKKFEQKILIFIGSSSTL